MPQDDATFGRAGLPTASGGDGLILKIATWQQRGDTARVTGFIRGTEQSTLADVKALRDQIQGYDLNPDEPVIPVTWESDPSRDGFYSVESVEVSSDVAGRSASDANKAEIHYRWEADLTRVPGCRSPLFEVLCSGKDRDTAHVITEWSWVGAPYEGVTGEWFSSLTSTHVVTTQAGPGNESAKLLSAPTGSKTAFYEDTFLYTSTVGGHYYASARIETSTDTGTTWRSLVGRQPPFAAVSSANQIRLSVGYMRFTITASALTYETWDSGGAAWESKTFKMTTSGSTATALDPTASLTVNYNRPELCSVRCWFGSGVVGYVDFTVRRGSWVVEARTESVGTTAQLGVFRTSNEAGTGVTGGVDANAADASGNKYQLRSPNAITAETTKGGIYLTSGARTAAFGIATDAKAGDNSTSPSTSGLYYAAMIHEQAVIAR